MNYTKFNEIIHFYSTSQLLFVFILTSLTLIANCNKNLTNIYDEINNVDPSDMYLGKFFKLVKIGSRLTSNANNFVTLYKAFFSILKLGYQYHWARPNFHWH